MAGGRGGAGGARGARGVREVPEAREANIPCLRGFIGRDADKPGNLEVDVESEGFNQIH